MPFKVLPNIDIDQVPDWDRRERKWEDLIKLIEEIPPGKTRPFEFDNHQEAKRARNAVRDTVNLRAGAVVIRTRVIFKDSGTAILYVSKLHPRGTDRT